MIAGLLLGLFGNLHCLGMCGGLALAARRRSWGGVLFYQLGRLSGYCLMGGLCGALGDVSRYWLGGAAVQGTVGVLLIGYGLGWLPALPRIGAMGTLLVWLGPILKKPSIRATALMGAVTCLLPCGLLGAAYLKASGSGLWGGVALMLAFWVGTLPALLANASLARFAGRGWVLGAAMVAVGLWTLGVAFWPSAHVGSGGCH